MPYCRHDVSGVTPDMSHTRNVERKMRSVGAVITRYVISNPPSKETDKTDKQTDRQPKIRYFKQLHRYRLQVYVDDRREKDGGRKTELRQFRTTPQCTVHNCLHIHRAIFVYCLSQICQI
jgi:hypothetical protein